MELNPGDSGPDSGIIDRVRAGDREAFAGLVRKYKEKVLRSCFFLLSSQPEAEDAAQEVFLKAFQSLNKFRGESSFSTWLYQITRRHCLDRLRQRSRQKTDSWDALLEREGERLHNAISGPPPAAGENAELAQRVLGLLPPDYREILVLREVQGLDYAEISRSLDCSLDAVKARLRRAREKLTEKLRHILDMENV